MIFDAAVLILLLIFVFWGTKRGVVKMIFSAANYAISIFLGCILYRPISGLLEKAGIAEGVSARIMESGAMGNLPGVMLDVPFVSESQQAVADAAASAALGAVSFFSVIVLSRIVLFIVSIILNAAGSMPVIRHANGLVGGIAGLGVGLVVEFIILGAIAVLEIFGKVSVTADLLTDSHIAAFMYNNNPLLGIAAGFGK
ncbi:MAG: CvpA family protein [Clostridia bacterium]